jgi:hypothetical protein
MIALSVEAAKRVVSEESQLEHFVVYDQWWNWWKRPGNECFIASLANLPHIFASAL